MKPDGSPPQPALKAHAASIAPIARTMHSSFALIARRRGFTA